MPEDQSHHHTESVRVGQSYPSVRQVYVVSFTYTEEQTSMGDLEGIVGGQIVGHPYPAAEAGECESMQAFSGRMNSRPINNCIMVIGFVDFLLAGKWTPETLREAYKTAFGRDVKKIS